MIHQVEQAEQNSVLLNDILQLQYILLEYAAERESLSNPLDDLLPVLQKTYPEDAAKQVYAWFTRGNGEKKIFKFLQSFACHIDRIEKRNFIEQIKHDNSLLTSPKSERFQLVYTDTIPPWKKAALDFLLGFYEIFSSENGFPTYLFTSEMRDKPFRRWEFINNFTEANPTLRLCAVCDSTIYRTMVNDKPYTSIEHFFPKSLYPHLSVHPLNLIPICNYCNSGMKGFTDTFGEDGKGLAGLLLPYQSGGGLRERAYIAIKETFNKNGKSQHPYTLEILPNNLHTDTQQTQTFIDNFERLYQVQARWNNDMDWLDEHVFRRIIQFLMADVQSANKLEDPLYLGDRLKILMASISLDTVGQDPFAFATIWMIKHHIDELEKCEVRAPLYIGVQGWASEQQSYWHRYRSHAEELRGRVPPLENTP